MSSPTVISVENLSKIYRLNHQAESKRYVALRDVIADKFKGLFRSQDRPNLPSTEDFWALNDVNFEIKQGDVVGIIGRNGAGKSTLLKVLSRITEPTKGRVRIKGRVASLLEVGTGFHPELTGRENIYLNGAILGMNRAEIRSKFDEIVAFAEVEKFLDTPVKRYSSGMYVRLAFAVAAHLEPEILVVDEVLAVGDAEFQKKCLGKMQDVSKGGRTVLFVSHNMGVIQSLCNRGILLQNGSVLKDSTVATAVGGYLDSATRSSTVEIGERVDRRGTGVSRLLQLTFGSGSSTGSLTTGRPAWFDFTVSQRLTGMTCCFTLYTQLGVPLAFFNSQLHSPRDQIDGTTSNKFICKLDNLYLLPGTYRLNAALFRNGEILDHIETAANIEVETGEVDGRQAPSTHTDGALFLPHIWISPSREAREPTASASPTTHG